MSSSESLKWRFLPSRLRQACTLLLTVLFVYDVFFVFITPFFTKVALQMPPRCRLSAVGHVMRNERLSLRRAARALWWRWRQALPTQPRTKRWRFFFLTLYIYINKKLIPSLILLVWSAASDGAQGAALELLPPRPMRSALLPAGLWRHPGARWLNDTRKSNCRRKTDWQHYIYIYFFFITFNFWCELSHWLWIRIAYNDPNQYEIQSQCETAIIGFQLWNYSYSCRLKNTLPIFFKIWN